MSALQSDVILERMMSLHPKVMDLTLGRVWRLLEQLGSPEKCFPLSSILQALMEKAVRFP